MDSREPSPNLTRPLTFATINLYGWQKRPAERFPLLEAGLAAALPDLVMLQEVSIEHGTAARLAGALTAAAARRGLDWEYTCVHQPHLRKLELSVGALTRFPVLEHHSLDLQGQGRVALGLGVDVAGRAIGLVSTHLYWEIGVAGDEARAVQARLLRDWVAATLPPLTLIGGDFNATPDSRAYALLRERWLSLHAAAHGAEPAWTCATPLAPAHNGWQGTLDYLFVAPATAPIEVRGAGVFLNRPAPTDPLLYPSDHLGIQATIALDGNPPA